MKILYIEDDPDSIHPIERIASYLGYELLVADTVAYGLEQLSALPDLVMVDMLLPDGDAITFTKKARLQWPALPIVILSGYADRGEREACFMAGCTDYYIKLPDIDILMALFKHYAAPR